jgi:adenine-specific DNA-methyltransferase
MAKDYASLSQDELINLVQRLENKRRYGLVWDEEQVPEAVVLDCLKFLPILKPLPVKGLHVAAEGSDHVLIQGDNYHALSVLSYTHKAAVDLIYIDPPYNTGNQEDEEGFVYNDKRVDHEDSYRHSKWLTFMSHRLELSRDLLKDNGFVFISIDEHEFAQLRLLCDQVFGEDNFINFLTWKKRSTGGQVKDGSIIAQTEFVFIYAKNKRLAKLNKLENPNVGNEKWRDLRKSGGQWQRRYRPKQYFPFFFDLSSGSLLLQRVNKSDIEIFPLDSKGEEGFWENGVDTATTRLSNGEFKAELIKSGMLKGQYKIKQLEVAGAVQNVGNFVDVPSVQGANEIKDLGLKFNNVKPLNLLDFILRIASGKDSTVLDFFAGSGTTGHAVMRLNSEDGGNRRVILCTNNESNVMAPDGICTDVTLPRLIKASAGYKNQKGEEVQGLGGRLRVFETDFVKNSKNRDQIKFDITAKCAEVLSLKEFAFDLHSEGTNWKIYSGTNKYVAMYFSLTSETLEELRQCLLSLDGHKVLYAFTLDPNGFDFYEFSEWVGVEIKDIPQKILDTYKRIFKI